MGPIADGAVVSGAPVVVWVGPGPAASAPEAARAASARLWLGHPGAGELPGQWLAVPTPEESRRERRLRRFVEAVGAGGPGGAALPWRSFALVADGRALNVIAANGGAWSDDLSFWLPKVLGDAPTVVVTTDPAESATLRELARRHSSSLLVVTSPGDSGAWLPDGRFGELVWWSGDGFWLTWSGAELKLASEEGPTRATWTWDGGWEVR